MSQRARILVAAGVFSLPLAGLPVLESSGAASTITEPPSDVSENTIDGLFDVGSGRNLYLNCEGTGSPTIVYLHGAGGASSNAGRIPSLLRDDYRFCVYDRANVGRSDPAEGPLTAADAVEDLNVLLAAAEIPGPYVLLGASYGGVVAFIYAATYPDDVDGLVLLDPDVPGIRAWEREFIPEVEVSLPDDAWMDDAEQVDFDGSLDELDAAAGNVPAVPAILFALEHYDLPPRVLDGAAEALHQLQEEAVGDFDPGEVRIVDTQHYMEPEIPGDIAAAVREVVSASPSTETSELSVATTSS